jgi:hypothetical protein
VKYDDALEQALLALRRILSKCEDIDACAHTALAAPRLELPYSAEEMREAFVAGASAGRALIYLPLYEAERETKKAALRRYGERKDGEAT